MEPSFYILILSVAFLGTSILALPGEKPVNPELPEALENKNPMESDNELSEEIKTQEKKTEENEAEKKENEILEWKRYEMGGLSENEYLEKLEQIQTQKKEINKEIKDIVEKVFVAGCDYNCPSGLTKIQNPNYIPSFNGCGPEGFNIDFLVPPRCKHYKQCCNQHDLCWDKCGISRDLCDEQFRDCLKKTSILVCQTFGELAYDIVQLTGCSIFRNNQQNACICV